jgi:hypothetical protein
MLVDHLAGRAKRGHDDRGLDFPKTPESAISAQHLLAKNRIICYRFPMVGRRAGPAPIGQSAMTGEKKERNKERSAGLRVCAQPEREFENGEKFSSFFGRNPLKSPDSKN